MSGENKQQEEPIVWEKILKDHETSQMRTWSSRTAFNFTMLFPWIRFVLLHGREDKSDVGVRIDKECLAWFQKNRPFLLEDGSVSQLISLLEDGKVVPVNRSVTKTSQQKGTDPENFVNSLVLSHVLTAHSYVEFFDTSMNSEGGLVDFFQRCGHRCATKEGWLRAKSTFDHGSKSQQNESKLPIRAYLDIALYHGHLFNEGVYSRDGRDDTEEVSF